MSWRFSCFTKNHRKIDGIWSQSLTNNRNSRKKKDVVVWCWRSHPIPKMHPCHCRRFVDSRTLWSYCWVPCNCHLKKRYYYWIPASFLFWDVLVAAVAVLRERGNHLVSLNYQSSPWTTAKMKINYHPVLIFCHCPTLTTMVMISVAAVHCCWWLSPFLCASPAVIWRHEKRFGACS